MLHILFLLWNKILNNTLWTLSYEIWILKCHFLLLYIPKIAFKTLMFEWWRMNCELWTVKCELWSVRNEVRSINYKLWSMTYEVWSMNYKVWCVNYIPIYLNLQEGIRSVSVCQVLKRLIINWNKNNTKADEVIQSESCPIVLQPSVWRQNLGVAISNPSPATQVP